MKVEVYINGLGPDSGAALSAVTNKLDLILALLGKVIQKEVSMSQQLTDLTTQVAQNTTVEAGAVTLIQGLAAQIAAAGTDPVALQALHDSLNTSATALAAAIAANTPASPAAPAA